MTPIYHITHYRNLKAIDQSGFLWCDNLAARRGVDPVGIAHQHIKQRRARRIVPLAARGTLADYVPFYFAPRSPMLCAIHNGRVHGYTGTQVDIVHLVSTVEIAIDSGAPWCFTDGHAEMAYAEFFDKLGDLGKIDWEIMRARYWAGNEKSKWKRQAELLSTNGSLGRVANGYVYMNVEMAERVRGGSGRSVPRPRNSHSV